jgi:RimJ/RimL family protein N-acetyltransferase
MCDLIQDESTFLEEPPVNLKPLEVSDADEMVVVLADEQLYEFIGGQPPERDELIERYRRLTHGGPKNGSASWFNWIVQFQGHSLGFIQATVTRVEGRLNAELAWVIGTRWQGRGFATIGARLVLDWLRSIGIKNITAHISLSHEASEAVARHIGMTKTTQFDEENECIWNFVIPADEDVHELNC